jgi:hypothetical protein
MMMYVETLTLVKLGLAYIFICKGKVQPTTGHEGPERE